LTAGSIADLWADLNACRVVLPATFQLAQIRDCVDVRRFYLDKVDTQLVNEPIRSCVDARKAIADALAVSQLP
jgi:hypothetical protein